MLDPLDVNWVDRGVASKVELRLAQHPYGADVLLGSWPQVRAEHVRLVRPVLGPIADGQLLGVVAHHNLAPGELEREPIKRQPGQRLPAPLPKLSIARRIVDFPVPFAPVRASRLRLPGGDRSRGFPRDHGPSSASAAYRSWEFMLSEAIGLTCCSVPQAASTSYTPRSAQLANPECSRARPITQRLQGTSRMVHIRCA